MYSKFISVAFVLAATLAPTSAVALPRGNAVDARDDPGIASASPMITPTITPTLATPTPTHTSSSTTSTSSTTYTSPTTSSSIDTLPNSASSTYTPLDTLTPSTTVTPIPNPSETAKRQSCSPSTSTCKNVLPWQVNVAYFKGDKVTFKNQLWTAEQFNYNSNPDSAAGACAWNLNGVCNPTPNCSTVVGWIRSTAYPSGSSVTYNGHFWISTQFTISNSPGDTSGAWKDLGACA